MTVYNYVKKHLKKFGEVNSKKEMETKVYEILKSYLFKKDLLDARIRLSPLQSK
jgi:hypothetical protein